MEATTPAEEKRTALEHLSFDARTGKRVAWEAWEFTVEGPHLVRVTNAAYGYLKDEHSYIVGVADHDGVLVPAECECPADRHHDGDCKHKVALAACGRDVVMQAAVDYDSSDDSDVWDGASTAADKLATDGGTEAVGGSGDSPLDASKHGACDCEKLPDDFPCWPCVRDGKREVPE